MALMSLAEWVKLYLHLYWCYVALLSHLGRSWVICVSHMCMCIVGIGIELRLSIHTKDNKFISTAPLNRISNFQVNTWTNIIVSVLDDLMECFFFLLLFGCYVTFLRRKKCCIFYLSKEFFFSFIFMRYVEAFYSNEHKT